jgi:hypothetical protein
LQVSGLGCASPLEDLERLLQQDPGPRGVTSSQGAAAEAGQ